MLSLLSHSSCALDLWITHGQNMQDCCRKYSQWSCCSRTLPQSDPGTQASCRNTSGPLAGSSSIWQERSRVHMSRPQRWPALWQHGLAPDETGFPELWQNCEETPTNTDKVVKSEVMHVPRWKITHKILTIFLRPHPCCLLSGRARSLDLPLCQNVSYRRTGNHRERQKYTLS